MTTAEPPGQPNRFSTVNSIKSKGATYTPRKLAQFVAEKMVDAWDGQWNGSAVRVLDPAAGDGELLLALVERLRSRYPNLPLQIYGFESSEGATDRACRRLSQTFPEVPAPNFGEDFLDHVLELFGDNRGMLACNTNPEPYDLVIANPPYVRTQVMGAQRARWLKKRFGLTGRVDLYHAFMLGIAKVMRHRGISGMILSNRFMTTRSGAKVREEILKQLRVLGVWDFGDTKLFDASVLPAVVLASGRNGEFEDSPIPFKSIYQTRCLAVRKADDVLDAISHQGVVEVADGRRFQVTCGELLTDGTKDGVWRVANQTTETWLERVNQNTWATFGSIGKVRVGVKTCADKVFIRSDWDEWPSEQRPELLRPVTTHHIARPFKPLRSGKPRFILYPHETDHGRRRAINLSKYPRSASYFGTTPRNPREANVRQIGRKAMVRNLGTSRP